MARLSGCTLAAIVILGFSAAPAFAGWIDGAISGNNNSQECVTGNNNVETATDQFVGYYAPDSGGVPKVGQIYYVHVVVAPVGNACPNGWYGIDIQLHLPKNTYLAISSSNPIYCLLTTNIGAASPTWVSSNSQGFDCPTSASYGTYPYPSSGWWRFDATSSPNSSKWPPGLWYGVRGQGIQVQVPVFSTTPLHGLGDDNSFLTAAITTSPYYSVETDGPQATWDFNGIPDGPYEPVWVDYNPPTIFYISPATTSITNTSVHTKAYLNDYFVAGTAYTDLGKTTSYGTSHADSIDGQSDQYWVAQDFSGLAPGTTYHWRLRFVPAGGSPACKPAGSAICGAEQTFTTSGSSNNNGGTNRGTNGGTTHHKKHKHHKKHH